MDLLHFVVAPDGPAARSAGRAAVELGARIGVPFRVVPEWGHVPADGYVLAWGVDKLPRGMRGLAVPRGRGRARTARTDDGPLYGPALGDSPGVDVIAGAGELLQFGHEAGVRRDAMGRIPPAGHPLGRVGLIREPLIENAARHLRRRIGQAGLRLPPPRRPFAPAATAVVLSHDTDGPRLLAPFALLRAALGAMRSAGERRALAAGARALLPGHPDPYWNFDGWRQLISERGGRSTFYVHPGPDAGPPRHARDPRYDPRAPRFRDTLAALSKAGFEIGLHQGINANAAGDFAAGRERLGEVTGKAPAGGRAHYWRLDWNDPHGYWAEMAQAGLSHDSSLSPMTLGFRNGASLPMIGGWLDPYSRSELPFVVLPCAVMDSYYHEAVRSGAGRFRVCELLRRAAEHGLIVLNWHVRTLSDTGPWTGFGTEARGLLRTLANSGGSEFITASEAARRWRAHLAALWKPL